MNIESGVSAVTTAFFWLCCCVLSIARAIPAVQHDLNFAVVACDVVMEKRGETAKLRRALVDYKTKDKSKAKR